MGLVGKAPMMPDYGMGFWQCKLRYQTQEQLLEVARKYKSLGLPSGCDCCGLLPLDTTGRV